MRQAWLWTWMAVVGCGGEEEPAPQTQPDPGVDVPRPEEPAPTPEPASAPLRNGDAENCPDLGPWETTRPDAIEVVAEQDQGQGGPLVTPWEGECFISFGRAAAGKERLVLRQSGAAAPGTVLTLTGVFRTSGSDVATFGFGGREPMLREAQASVERWTPFSISHVVPESDDAWVVELGGDLYTGSGVNVFFDALVLTERDGAVPFRPTCGDGVVDPDEACDEGPANGAGRCTLTCDDAYGDACILVEDAFCTNDTANAPPGESIDWVAQCFGNSSATPDGVSGRERAAQCAEVRVCLWETACAADGQTLEDCFCGDIEWEDCLAHDPPAVTTAAGPCVAQIEAAAGLPQGDDTLGEHLSGNRQNVDYPFANALLLDRCVGSDVRSRPMCW